MPEEYISRADALKDFEACNADNPHWTPQRVKTLLLRQPAADVAEVVRCKDCIYNIDGLCFCRRPLGRGRSAMRRLREDHPGFAPGPRNLKPAGRG